MAILAISLDFRSGGQEVATQVGEALGYKCSGKDQSIAYMKAAGGRWESLFRELDQERPSLADRQSQGRLHQGHFRKRLV